MKQLYDLPDRDKFKIADLIQNSSHKDAYWDQENNAWTKNSSKEIEIL